MTEKRASWLHIPYFYRKLTHYITSAGSEPKNQKNVSPWFTSGWAPTFPPWHKWLKPHSSGRFQKPGANRQQYTFPIFLSLDAPQVCDILKDSLFLNIDIKCSWYLCVLFISKLYLSLISTCIHKSGLFALGIFLP